MTASPTTRPAVPARRGAYFFLSYAHSAPSNEERPADTDHWVGVFYRDLAETVRRIADPAAGLSPGFVDELIQPGADWNAALSDALGAAEVFVALYSPGYFNKSWPLRERESFLQRLRRLEGAADPQRHVLPVLWIPLLSWKTPPEARDALELGEGVPEYAENGLRALCMLPSYDAGYRTILERIARRIVEVAERSPIGPSAAPPPEAVPVDVEADPQFVVAVAAPAAGSRPLGRSPRTYGAKPEQWRPFAGEQAVPLARYVANTAERLGLAPRIVTYADDPRSVGASAAVLLIDAWAAAGAVTAATLRAQLATLPEWVMPMVIVDPRDPQYDEQGAALAQQVAGMLTASGPPQVIEARDVGQFFASIPVLVTEARRRYLRLGPAYPPKDHTGDPGRPPRARKQSHG